MSAVWANGPDNKTELLILLALADNADDYGKCWPSYETIAKKSRVSKRHVMRIISKLCADGYLRKRERMNKDGQTSNLYQINIELIGGDTVSLGGVTNNVTGGGDNRDTGGVTPMSPESSVNHKYEPSIIPESLNTDVFLAVWEEWQQYRKEIKKPLKPTSIKYQLRKLKEYPPETAAAMLTQSIENQWQGIFELKNGSQLGELKVAEDGSINV